MFGRRTVQTNFDCLPYLWTSAVSRLNPEALRACDAWFHGGAYGKSKMFLASAIQTDSIARDDSSFHQDIFRPRFDELLNIAKQNLKVTELPFEREMQLTRSFLHQITQWLDVPEHWIRTPDGAPTKPHIEVLATVFIGAILDCYLQPRPLMKVAGVLSAEACTEVAALTASTWMKEQKDKIG